MATMLVQNLDKMPLNPIEDCKAYKRGMVVDIQEDDHKWGTAETNPNGQFTLVSVPGVSKRDLLAFLTPEPIKDPGLPNLFLTRRAFKFDIDAYKTLAAAPDAPKVDVKTSEVREGVEVKVQIVAIDEAVTQTLKLAVPSVDDPTVLDNP